MIIFRTHFSLIDKYREKLDNYFLYETYGYNCVSYLIILFYILG